MNNAEIAAHGHYAPEKILDNNFFVNSPNNPYKVYLGKDGSGNPIFKPELVYLIEEKILKNTGGIKQRRQVADKETLVDMIEKAFINSKFPAEELRGIIVGTISDEIKFPSVACRVQERIGAKNVRNAVDIGAACSGFTHALDYAYLKIEKGEGPYLVIGAETLTRCTDYEELNCDLFGDGCGLVVLAPTQDNSKGILATEFDSDISGINFIYRDKLGKLRMPQGPEVLKKATRGMIDIAHRLLEKTNCRKEEVKLYIPHQFNGNGLNIIEKKIDPREGILYRNIENYGNMSAATVPLALSQALEYKVISKGDLIVLVDIGAGLALGGSLIRI